MLASIFGTDSLYVLIIAVVVLFGGSQLPKLARNAGEAMKEFRKAHNEAQSPLSSPSAAAPVTTSAPAAPPPAPSVPMPPVALPPVASQAAPAGTAPEERVSLTRSELDALLADREARAKSGQGGNEARS